MQHFGRDDVSLGNDNERVILRPKFSTFRGQNRLWLMLMDQVSDETFRYLKILKIIHFKSSMFRVF